MNIIKQKRIEKGICINEISESLNIRERDYTVIENDFSSINAFLLMEICKILDINVNCIK